ASTMALVSICLLALLATFVAVDASVIPDTTRQLNGTDENIGGQCSSGSCGIRGKCRGYCLSDEGLHSGACRDHCACCATRMRNENDDNESCGHYFQRNPDCKNPEIRRICPKMC
ncbi:unnamed protein product, partial [Meganyctiphanes norvegica]